MSSAIDINDFLKSTESNVCMGHFMDMPDCPGKIDSKLPICKDCVAQAMEAMEQSIWQQ